MSQSRYLLALSQRLRLLARLGQRLKPLAQVWRLRCAIAAKPTRPTGTTGLSEGFQPLVDDAPSSFPRLKPRAGLSKGFQPLATLAAFARRLCPRLKPRATIWRPCRDAQSDSPKISASRRRALMRFFLLLKAAAVLVWVAWPSQHGPALLLNISASEPVGLYRRVEVEPARGVLVAACLAPRWAALALERGYVSRGRRCASGTVPVLKSVAALAGDEVAYGAGALSVNGRELPHSALRMVDHTGRAVPLERTFPYRLAPDEVLLLADHEGSFDGRYFGPSKWADVLGVYVPLIVWGGARDD